MTSTLEFGTLGLYVASLALYSWFLFANQRPLGRGATLCLVGGLGLHYLALVERARAVHSVPYQDFSGSLSLFAWLLALTYLGVETVHRQRSVGPFVLPIVILLVLGTTLVPPLAPTSPPPARGTVFALHVTSNILAYSAFALSCVLSLIYLVQNRVLRRRRPGTVFWRFPALEVLERMSRSSVAIGVVALAVGTVLGFVSAHRILGHFWTADPKEIVSLGLLLCYAGYLWLARTAGWRGARASLLCVLSFVFVLFSYTVVNFYLSRYHRYF